jgi:hypothetical protein
MRVMMKKIKSKKQMEKITLVFGIITFALCIPSAFSQSVVDSPREYPLCIYGNRNKGTQTSFSCRVITNSMTNEVIFIDEYTGRSFNSRLVSRHDESQVWYAPVMRKNQCLLRRQGAEFICLGKPWSGV